MNKYAPLRTKLLEERERVQELLDIEIQRRVSLSEPGDQERYGNHPADEGSETFEKEKSVALQANLQVILDEVEQALRKFDVGTYGRCEECGGEIPYERLEVRPQSTLDVACKSKIEHTAQVSQGEGMRAFR